MVELTFADSSGLGRLCQSGKIVRIQCQLRWVHRFQLSSIHYFVCACVYVCVCACVCVCVCDGSGKFGGRDYTQWCCSDATFVLINHF